jgi:Tol biopolymer transport system component
MTGLISFPSKPAAPAAHGLPYDLWLVKPDGSGLKRLTTLFEDHTMPAWSNDGKKITFLTGLALYTIDADGKNLVKKSDRGGQQAGFVWRSN